MNLQKRLTALEKIQRDREGGLYTVYFKDGTKKRIHPGDCLPMALDDDGKIDHFEEGDGCHNDGVLEGLANILLGGG